MVLKNMLAVEVFVTQQIRITWKYLYIQQFKNVPPMGAIEFWMKFTLKAEEKLCLYNSFLSTDQLKCRQLLAEPVIL